MRRPADLYFRWASEVARSGLFRPGGRVGVAVSGGPDSVLLLEFMRRLARDSGLRLAVVHFNHHLRGVEADEDESFVRGLARQHDLEFLCGEADVIRVAREHHRNVEAMARELRYRFFFSLVSKGKVEKVATAHTANDQAETVLLKLFRGAGTRGLAGIYPVLEKKVVRPFLNLTRAEIERELKRRKLEYRVDRSNREVRLRRNKIRAELLPHLEKEYSPRIVPLLKDLADRARDDEEYMEDRARESARAWRVREGAEEKIAVRALLEFPRAIARRVLRQMVLAAGHSAIGLSHNHIEALLRFTAQAQSGRSLALPGDLIVRKDFDWLIISPKLAESNRSEFSYTVHVPGEVFVPEIGVTFGFKIVSPEGLRKSYNGMERAGLDRQKLLGELKLRNWRAGDRFRPLGSPKHMKLKELLRQQRIPSVERRHWPVLESENEIVWVRGFPPADAVAASPACSDVLMIEETALPR